MDMFAVEIRKKFRELYIEAVDNLDAGAHPSRVHCAMMELLKQVAEPAKEEADHLLLRGTAPPDAMPHGFITPFKSKHGDIKFDLSSFKPKTYETDRGDISIITDADLKRTDNA